MNRPCQFGHATVRLQSVEEVCALNRLSRQCQQLLLLGVARLWHGPGPDGTPPWLQLADRPVWPGCHGPRPLHWDGHGGGRAVDRTRDHDEQVSIPAHRRCTRARLRMRRVDSVPRRGGCQGLRAMIHPCLIRASVDPVVIPHRPSHRVTQRRCGLRYRQVSAAPGGHLERAAAAGSSPPVVGRCPVGRAELMSSRMGSSGQGGLWACHRQRGRWIGSGGRRGVAGHATSDGGGDESRRGAARRCFRGAPRPGRW